jgi:excisionase family DNA binding protein
MTTHQAEILNRKEASDFLKVPIRTVDFLVATGQIPFSRLGRRRVVFLRDRLMEYLREREGVVYNRPSKVASE